MNKHDKKKNYSNYVETAITAIGIIAIFLGLIIAGIINLIINQ